MAHSVLGALFLAAGLPAAAIEAFPPTRGYLALLGGGGPTFGAMDAFTQASPSAARRSDSRPFDASSALALRLGAWVPGSPWGAALEPSRVRMPVSGGKAEAWACSLLLFARPPALAARRVFPYAALGPSLYALTARADYRPNTAAELYTVEYDEVWGTWTFDVRAGVQARALGRLSLIAEARLTRFALNRQWTPATWMGPPARWRDGISVAGVPLLFQAGVAYGF